MCTVCGPRAPGLFRRVLKEREEAKGLPDVLVSSLRLRKAACTGLPHFACLAMGLQTRLSLWCGLTRQRPGLGPGSLVGQLGGKALLLSSARRWELSFLPSLCPHEESFLLNYFKINF